jgi:hypothetical protein
MQMSLDPAEFTRLVLWTIEKRVKITGSTRRNSDRDDANPPLRVHAEKLLSSIHEWVRPLRAGARSGPIGGPSRCRIINPAAQELEEPGVHLRQVSHSFLSALDEVIDGTVPRFQNVAFT